MKLSKHEVLNLAKLAKLELSDTEIKDYQKQLVDVLDYVDKINNLKLNKVKESLTGAENNEVGPRPDKVELSDPKIIQQANVLEDNYVVAPNVFKK